MILKPERNLNQDPFTGEPGSHPVGSGLGAVSGAAAGAAVGAAAGPIGSATGAVIGAIAGGIAGGVMGQEIAEYVNPTEVENYWEDGFAKRPYVKEGESFDAFRPAYRMGYDAIANNPAKPFSEVEGELGKQWQSTKGGSSLEWERARDAAKDSYDYTARLYSQRRYLEDQIEPDA
jgi:hypothetical protein